MEKHSRPNKVSIAVTLLWISFAIGVFSSMIYFSNFVDLAKASDFGSGFVIFVNLFSFVFMAFLIYLIGEGKNWARITFLALFIIGIPLLILPTIQLLITRPILGIVVIGQTILQIITLVFLFQKPSSDWFKLMKDIKSKKIHSAHEQEDIYQTELIKEKARLQARKEFNQKEK